MVGYYRGFCPNLSTIVSLLITLLGFKEKFVWSAECVVAFEAVKDLLCHVPVLSPPNFSLPFKLEVDSYAMGAGAVLLQKDKMGIDHPFCYFSKKNVNVPAEAL